MNKKIIATEKAPAAIGPYSQGVRIDNFIFTSGQIPLDPISGEVVGTDIKAQATQCLENLKAVLAAENASLANVVKTTVFLADMSLFADFNAVYATYFSAPFPGRSCFAVKALPKNVLVEIEAIACL